MEQGRVVHGVWNGLRPFCSMPFRKDKTYRGGNDAAGFERYKNSEVKHKFLGSKQSRFSASQ